MAKELEQDTSSHESESESGDSRIDALVARFEKEDEAAGAPASEDDEQEEQDEPDEPDDDDELDDSGHPEDDTGDQRDDADDEPSDDPDEEDEADTVDEQDDDESDEPNEEDDESNPDDQPDDADEDDASDETKAALARHGADLTLDQIPEKYRGIVGKKLKQIDQAFTRAQQEATAFRKVERQYRADETFRTENPDLVIVDLLRKGGPKLFDAVNKMISRIDPEAEGNDPDSVKDAETLLDEKIQMRRNKAAEAINEADQRVAQINEAADQVEQMARDAAKQFKVPFGSTIEQLLEAAILRKPDAERANGLTKKEIHAIIKGHADEHFRSVRAHRREESRGSVKDRTERRSRPKPTVRRPGGTASSTTRRPAKEKVDHNDAESRQKAMMKSARRIMPGVKD